MLAASENRCIQPGIAARTEQGFVRLPPPDMLYIHRKLGGLFLLLKRLGAKIPVSELIAPYRTRRQ